MAKDEKKPGSEKKARGLGRGLSALLADVDLGVGSGGGDNSAEAGEQSASARSGGPASQMVPIEQLKPNPNQPRRDFGDEELGELAASIGEKGIVQPILVRQSGADSYQIVAGERRWRAAQKAKLHLVPVLVRDYDDREVQEIALIENIQRQDLNAMEEAEAFQSLIEQHGQTQEELAKALGKSRSHVANLLRLTKLPISVQNHVRAGKLSMGHARALVGADNAEALAKKAIAEGWSVREIEKQANAKPDGKGEKRPAAKPLPSAKDADTKLLESELSANLGMKLRIGHNDRGSGYMTIYYADLEALDKLCRRLGQ